MAEDGQHACYDIGKRRMAGSGRSLKDDNVEFEEHQIWDNDSNTNNVSCTWAGSNQLVQQVYKKPASPSAPMAIPDRHKFYGTRSHEVYADEEGEMMPPHEYIAKKLASSQISSFSVCEGAGRTLKGRDLIHVRNAILTKTGFIE